MVFNKLFHNTIFILDAPDKCFLYSRSRNNKVPALKGCAFKESTDQVFIFKIRNEQINMLLTNI